MRFTPNPPEEYHQNIEAFISKNTKDLEFFMTKNPKF